MLGIELGPLEDQATLLTTDPSLQACMSYFLTTMFNLFCFLPNSLHPYPKKLRSYKKYTIADSGIPSGDLQKGWGVG